MSRYRDWTNALNGCINYMHKQGFDKNNRWDDTYKAIVKFCKKNGIQGSFSTKCLAVGKRFSDFKDYVKTINKL